jgi:hypothetical protein
VLLWNRGGDIACLHKLNKRYAPGAVKATSHAKAIRSQLHHKAGIQQSY